MKIWILEIWRMGNMGNLILRKVSESSLYCTSRSLRMHGFNFCYQPAFRPWALLPVAQRPDTFIPNDWRTVFSPWPGENSTSFW